MYVVGRWINWVEVVAVVMQHCLNSWLTDSVLFFLQSLPLAT